MFIVLNGPLGIGKSALAEALTESIEHCVTLSGDALVAVNPPTTDELEHLHSTIELLVSHHHRFGYHHFVVEHIWRSRAELADLRRRLIALDADADVRCFLLTLPEAEHLRRIERRQQARVIDERAFELRAVAEERQALTPGSDLGEPFDVSAPPLELVPKILRRLAAPGRGERSLERT
jgi:hypothetical protein